MVFQLADMAMFVNAKRPEITFIWSFAGRRVMIVKDGFCTVITKTNSSIDLIIIHPIVKLFLSVAGFLSDVGASLICRLILRSRFDVHNT
jgi:hypothetical protein